MPTLRATIDAAISAVYSATGLAAVTANLAYADNISIASGVGVNQGDLMFAQNRSLLTAAADNLDLTGVLLDPLGTVLPMVKVIAILIRSDSANTTDLTIGNGANPFVGPFGAGTHTIALQPGGAIQLVAPKAGWTVTPTTGDILKIANAAGATNNYSIVILGRSA
jgi:hypothetical protein